MIKKVWLTAITEISLALIILFSGSMSYAGEMADAPAVFEEQALWLDPGKSDASAGADYDSAGDAAVKDVIDRIAALPDPDKISLIYREYIDKAKDALNKLSPEDQARVPETARKKLAADDEAVKKLELAEDKKKAAAVAEKMCSLKGTRAGKGKAATEAARMAYDALTDAQKKYIPNNALVSLIDAEEAYEAGRVFKCGSALYKVLPSGDVTYREPVNLLSKSETVPNQVKKTGYYFLVIKISIAAFKDCRNLEELVISKSIRSIGEYALKNTPKLTKVTVLTKRLTAGKIIRAFSGSGRFKGAGITVSAPQGFVFRYEKIFKGSGGLNENARFDVIT